ncbi:MAG: hypothetical protein U9Q76_09635 [candidate division WOR-3 bacterium]|nr:hypothetical protein [candidate division WOR-3 bacterium]
MAKTRHLFFEVLRRSGNALFRFFCRCEERGVMPRTARWIKVSVLSAFIAGISTLGAASMLSYISCCYAPIIPEPYVEGAKITPNPTDGADSVTVEAHAYIESAPEDEFHIARAVCVIEKDTTELEAEDGKFDSQDENIRGRAYVGGLEPGTTKVYVTAFNNEGEWGNEDIVDLEVTEEQE